MSSRLCPIVQTGRVLGCPRFHSRGQLIARGSHREFTGRTSGLARVPKLELFLPRALNKASIRFSATQAQLKHPLRRPASQATRVKKDYPPNLISPDEFDPSEIRGDLAFPSLPISFAPPPSLSNEQRQILERVLRGESIFFTGSAGTGKSVLLRAIIEALGGPSPTLAVTASTGIAAVNIGGQTLHSFAGAGLANQDTRRMVQRVKADPEAYERWLSTKVLIIDEISMVSSRLFDRLEDIARKVRKIKEPFGGIQLVLCGDFFQLPPVPEDSETAGIADFPFDAFTWDRCVPNRIALTQVFRQKDPRLVKMLNDMRVGHVTPESDQLLRSLARPVQYSDGIGPTELYPVRRMADESNAKHLKLLPGEVVEFESKDTYGRDEYKETIDPTYANHVLGRMIVPQKVKLKVGAQVMCVRNLKNIEIVNGSVAKVVDFMRPAMVRALEEYRSKDESPVLIVSSLEPKKKKDSGKSTKAVALKGDRLKPSAKLADWYENTEWPIVEFKDGVRAMLGPALFTSETVNGIVQASRLQVPLILAWALTVHKSQGQTLDRVKIDLRYTFERGQAYVAISRCTSLEGLEVYNYARHTVIAHPRVSLWSKGLVRLDTNPFIPSS